MNRKQLYSRDLRQLSRKKDNHDQHHHKQLQQQQLLQCIRSQIQLTQSNQMLRPLFHFLQLNCDDDDDKTCFKDHLKHHWMQHSNCIGLNSWCLVSITWSGYRMVSSS